MQIRAALRFFTCLSNSILAGRPAYPVSRQVARDRSNPTLAVLLATTLLFAALSHAEETASREARAILDTEFSAIREAELALSGAPAHLRDRATVFVYQRGTGYTLHRQGDNGFTCLLNRDAFFYGESNFKPTCWDANGRDSYVPVMLAVGQWLAAGLTTDDMERQIDDGFDEGSFVSPENSGVAYMIAGDLQLDLESGDINEQDFPGHYMFYAPGISSLDLGTTSEAQELDDNLPVVFSGGAGGERLGYIITMVGHIK